MEIKDPVERGRERQFDTKEIKKGQWIAIGFRRKRETRFRARRWTGLI